MLHTLTYEFDLPQDRTLQLKLPDTIKIGKHLIVLVILNLRLMSLQTFQRL
jgi:hypothetical protein